MSGIGGRLEVEGGKAWRYFYVKLYNAKSFLMRFL